MEGQTDRMDVDHSQEGEGGGKQGGEGSRGGINQRGEGSKVG